jgi:hypothetical protein
MTAVGAFVASRRRLCEGACYAGPAWLRQATELPAILKNVGFWSFLEMSGSFELWRDAPGVNLVRARPRELHGLASAQGQSAFDLLARRVRTAGPTSSGRVDPVEWIRAPSTVLREPEALTT